MNPETATLFSPLRRKEHVALNFKCEPTLILKLLLGGSGGGELWKADVLTFQGRDFSLRNSSGSP